MIDIFANLPGLMVGIVYRATRLHLTDIPDLVRERTSRGWPMVIVTDFPVDNTVQSQAAERVIPVLNISEFAAFERALSDQTRPPPVTLIPTFKKFQMVSLYFSNIYAQRGDLDAALEWAENAVHVDPTRAHLCMRALIHLHMRRGEFSKALDAGLKATRWLPNDELLCFSLSEVYRRLGERRVALEWIEKALVRNPANAGFYDFKALLCCELEDFSAAESSARRATAMEPANANFRSRLMTVRARAPKHSIGKPV